MRAVHSRKALPGAVPNPHATSQHSGPSWPAPQEVASPAGFGPGTVAALVDPSVRAALLARAHAGGGLVPSNSQRALGMRVPRPAYLALLRRSLVVTALTATTASVQASGQESDAATYAVAVSRPEIEEGQETMLTVAITNEVTSEEDQTVSLAVSGTASTDDYTLASTELTLAAGKQEVTVTLEVTDDGVSESAETITIAASVAGANIGTATVTIHPSDTRVGPQWKRNPIRKTIPKGDIVLAAVPFVRAPETEDPEFVEETTDAYARIQYLKPVPGSTRLALSDLRGILYMMDADGSALAEYLDLRDESVGLKTDWTPSEMGLLGFAFHPEFAESGQPGYGKFYTAFSVRENTGVADYLDNLGTHESVVREWTATDPEAATFAGSSREVLRIGQAQTVQNIGTLAFNTASAAGSADYGNLYIGMGDGGGLNDGQMSGQNLSSPHAAILRIDPLGRDSDRGYGIPSDNPFVGVPGVVPEIWAYGLRHPQHFSFDATGKMFINDIGESQVEEVNIGRAGANYGWRLREGTFATAFGAGATSTYDGQVFTRPEETDGTFEYPVVQFDHKHTRALEEGHALATGFVYEGSEIASLQGKYVFANLVAGKLFVVDVDGLTPGTPAEFEEVRLTFNGVERTLLDVVAYPDPYQLWHNANAKRADVRLSVDHDGELYILTKGDGWIRRLTAPAELTTGVPEVSIAAGAGSVTEGAPAAFTVTLGAAAAGELTVSVRVTDSGSTLSGAPPTSVTLGQGNTSATLTVPTLADTVVEADSTVTAALEAGSGYTLGTALSASVTVVDDDTATFGVSAAPAAIVEGESSTVTVAITNGVTFAEDQTITLDFTGSTAAEGTDFTVSPAAIVLLAGESSATAMVTALSDTGAEGEESVAIAASRAGGVIGTTTLAIRNAAPLLPEVSIAAGAGSVTEGAPAAFTVTLGAAAAGELTVSVRVTDSGSTLSGAPPTSVTLGQGNTSATLTVPTLADTVVEADSTVTAALEAGSGYTLGTALSASVTVVDDDTATFGVSAAPAAIVEGESSTVTVAITNGVTFAEDQTITLDFTGSTAAEGTDFTVSPAAIVLLAGESSATAMVTALSDTGAEGEESVAIAASRAGGVIGTTTLAIRNAAPLLPEVSIAAGAGSVTEGAPAAFTVTLGAAAAGELTVSVRVTDSGSTLSGAPPTSVTLGQGNTSATLTVPTLADTVVEADSTVTAALEAGSGYTLGTALSASVTVVDDDTATFGVSAAPAAIVEGESSTVTVAITNGVTFAEDQTITLDFTGSTAAEGTDFTVSPAAIVLLAGESSATAMVTALSDTGAEGEESVAIAASRAGGVIGTTTLAIRNAAPPLPEVSIAAVRSQVSEGERAEFRLTLADPAKERLSVAIRWEFSDGSDALTMQSQFWPGITSKTPYHSRYDDRVVREDVTVTLTVEDGEGYKVSEEARSAQVVLEENDEAEFALSVGRAEIAEGETAEIRVAITNGVTFAEDQTITLDFTGSTAAEGTDFTVSPAVIVLPAGERSATATVTALSDTGAEGEEGVAIAASRAGGVIGTTTLAIADGQFTPLTAEFLEMPETHDGETAFEFELRFSEKIKISFRTLRDDAFEVTGGTIRRARRVTAGSNLRWEIRVRPASDASVVLVLPATTDCEAAGAVCTAGAKPLSQRLEATIQGPASQAQGFSLAPENGSPSGIWSNGKTAWVADLDDAWLYAYGLPDGSREPQRDFATAGQPLGLWSNGETMWVASPDSGMRAYRLSDGERVAPHDLAATANRAPVGLWSDGETMWVSDWLGDTVYAYRLEDGDRDAGRDVRLADENLLPMGLWSDGETLWVADWGERIYSYEMSDGKPTAGVDVGGEERDGDPTGLWSDGETLLSTSWGADAVRAFRLPAASQALTADSQDGTEDRAAGLSAIADPALRAGVAAALGGGPVGARDLTRLEVLRVRNAGVRDLTGLEGAINLRELDLGFNPVADLRLLASQPHLSSLNLDGVNPDLRVVASLRDLERLSLRHNGIEDVQALGSLTGLVELDVGDNRLEDLRSLQTLAELRVLRADRNRISDAGPLVSLGKLEALDLGGNQVQDLHPFCGLVELATLQLDDNGLSVLHQLTQLPNLRELGLSGNQLEDVHALSGLTGLQRLDLRGNAIGDLRPLQTLPSLAWVHVGGSGIPNAGPLEGVEGLTLAGRDDQDAPRVPEDNGRDEHEDGPDAHEESERAQSAQQKPDAPTVGRIN